MILRKIKYDPDISRGNSSCVKPKNIELNRNIGHKSVMSICELSIDRDDPDHILYQVIHDKEVILYASAKGFNGMVQLFTEALLNYGAAVLLV